MAILRVNNVGDPTGTVNPITLASAAATTATWVTPPLNMPTVASPNVLKIIAEPNTSNEEIMYLTAYTGSVTSATVTRAQEGTTARTHTSTAWVHGSTAADFSLGGDVSGGTDVAKVTQIQGHGVWNNTPTAQSFFLGDGNGNWAPYSLNTGSTSAVAIANRGGPGGGFDFVISDSAWYAFPLGSGVVPYGGSFRTPSVRVINGIAYLDGLMTSNTAIGTGGLLGTLPANARPMYETLCLTMTINGPQRLDVFNNGQIINEGPSVASGGWISCANITFLTS